MLTEPQLTGRFANLCGKFSACLVHVKSILPIHAQMHMGLTMLRMTALYGLRASLSVRQRFSSQSDFRRRNGIMTENHRNKCAAVGQTHTHVCYSNPQRESLFTFVLIWETVMARSRNLALDLWKYPLGAGSISTISQLVTSFQISGRRL